ncbi:MAG: acetyl-CoA carboxylase biotin carboxyl carrier protein [Chloroflexi bacterium]|nr:acetyl-CoA carboxylase biotin carboxyl carrier protein [Chloroflexota bacterium]
MTEEIRPPEPLEPGSPVDGGVAGAPQPRDAADVELLGLIDRLADLLDHSDLTELEVRSGETELTLRKPAAFAAASAVPAVAAAATSATAEASDSQGEPAASGREPTTPARPSVKAPLTGIFYTSPAPGSASYVKVGGELAVGQVIGRIEAMKLFNEIKSDLAGRVVRVLPESGTLVKAKQPLIEVEPL